MAEVVENLLKARSKYYCKAVEDGLVYEMDSPLILQLLRPLAAFSDQRILTMESGSIRFLQIEVGSSVASVKQPHAGQVPAPPWSRDKCSGCSTTQST